MRYLLFFLILSFVLGNEQEDKKGNAFFKSLSSILVSELGDKTFFVAMIMSMRYNKSTVFLGAYSALFVQTVLSCAVGFSFIQFIPQSYVKTLSMILFFVFGLKLIKDGYETENNEGMLEELREVELEMDLLNQSQDLGFNFIYNIYNHLKVIQIQYNLIFTHILILYFIQNQQFKNYIIHLQLKYYQKLENQKKQQQEQQQPQQPPFKFIFWNALTITFLGEMGDRSQITTIVLSSLYNPVIICLGALLGHFICTGGACICGHYIKDRLSQKAICYCGGILFLLFGLVILCGY